MASNNGKLILNRAAVLQPVQQAVARSSEMVNFCFSAMEKEDLSLSPKRAENKISFKGPDCGAEERRAAFESWILARALHDVLRGCKESLEQADVYLGLLDQQPATQNAIDSLTARLKKKAQNDRFEVVMKRINKRLDPTLEFPEAYLSLQQARNCLEHRAGIVGLEDTRRAVTFKLTFPRIKLFYMKNGAEVEVMEGVGIEGADDHSDVAIHLMLDIRHREYSIGDRLDISPSEFNEIAFAANLLGEHLANRLP